MNVYMAPIPWGIGYGALYKQLRLYLDDLQIYAFNFSIHVQRNGNNFSNGVLFRPPQRTRFAIVTLPSVELGRIFLDRYGTVNGPPNPRNGRPTRIQVRNPIVMSNMRIICSEARSQPSSDQIHMVLGLVQKQNEEVWKRKQRTKEKTVVIKQKEKEFAIKSVECGVWNYDPGQYDATEFVKRYELVRPGKVKFRPARVIIDLHSIGNHETDLFIGFDDEFLYDINMEEGESYAYSRKREEEKRHLLMMPNHTIMSIDTDSRREVFFTLDCSPKIYRCTPPVTEVFDDVRQNEKFHRVPGLDQQHEAFCRLSFVYKVVLEDPDALKSIIGLSGKAGIRPINPRLIKTIPLQPLQFYGDVKRLLHELQNPAVYPFPVAYQLHVLFANGILPPSTVFHLLPQVQKMLKIYRMDQEMVAEAIQLFSGRHFQSTREDTINIYDPLDSPDINTKESLLEILADKGRVMRDRSLGWKAEIEMRKEKEAQVYRTTITPTGIYSYGPTFEPQNRVLRKYRKFQDYFMRVSFSEEDSEPFRQDRDVDPSIILKLFRERLNHHGDGPIVIAGRAFKFLGFSSSSLKSLTCWFMADFPWQGGLMTPERLIRELGDFGKIKTAGRYAARIGQAFSDTMNSIHVDFTEEVDIHDILRRGKDGVERNFSDGIGRVSMGMVRRIWEQSGELERDRPTVFQVRYAGAKGVIALDSRLDGDRLCLRPSMVKFSGSNDRNIEICSWAGKRGVLTLNRPMIKVLEDLGVPPETFLDIQNHAVNLLYRSSRSPAHAANFFMRQNVSSPILKLPWVIDVLQNLDINFWDDPFLRQGLELALVAALRDYKYKARIPVDKGVTLMGVLDETGVLREGEVYISFEKDDGQIATLKGRVLVTRSPQYHPGDCQMVMAVEAPIDSPLRDLKNCIAFSQNGDRPLPSMLSGGDLDGDLYNIIWDERFHIHESFPPASYPPANPLSLGRPVTLPDVADFFIDFMQNNLLGMIATRHLIIADQEHEGIFHTDCITLSELASTSVDFPKTGIKVEMKDIPRAPNRARPDFLASGPRVIIEKNHALGIESINPLEADQNEGEEDDFGFIPQIWYRSDKVLGKLYRAIDEEKFVSNIGQNITRIATGTRTSVLGRILEYMELHIARLLPGISSEEWRAHIPDAVKKRTEYIHEMTSIAIDRSETPWKSSLREIEVFMGTVLGRGSSTNSKRHFDRVQQLRIDYNVLAEHTVKWMRGEDREELIGRAMASLLISLEGGGNGRGYGEEDEEMREGTNSWAWCAVCVLMVEVDQMQKEERVRVKREVGMGLGARKGKSRRVRSKKEEVEVGQVNGPRDGEDGDDGDIEELETEPMEEMNDENIRAQPQTNGSNVAAALAPEIRKLEPYVGLEELRRRLERIVV